MKTYGPLFLRNLRNTNLKKIKLLKKCMLMKQRSRSVCFGLREDYEMWDMNTDIIS